MGELRLLLAEDDPLDAELVLREIKKSGFEVTWHRVETEAEFARRLTEHPPDVVISDHAMPQFSAADALECLKKSGLVIPFLVVSHAIGEEEAVQLIHNGASDFLMKDRLGRLGEAIRHALEQHRLRIQHGADQAALTALNEQLERRVAERTAELEAATRTLEGELGQRKRAEEALQRLNAELEKRVEKRTAEVVASHHRLRALASELTLAEQRERKRLAGELHDYLAQMLALGRMKIAQFRPKIAGAVPDLTGSLREIDDLFKNALTYTRSLMSKLSPPVLDELGLPAALTWLADQMPLHGLSVDVRLKRDKVPMPDDQAVLLFQSVRELLINVAKHARTDRATVTLDMEHDQQLAIHVEDEGCGFDVAAVDARLAGEHFGLFSVRERMEAMGGRLLVESTPGAGTRITLTLPVGSAAPGALSPEAVGNEIRMSDPPLTAPGRRLSDLQDQNVIQTTLHNQTIRVLLVDDHTLVRQGLRALLESYSDLSVTGEAGDGEEAITMVAQLGPNVVLMDINMPWMDGIEATKRIKQDWPEIKVIGLSVNTSPQLIDAMAAAGAAAFVSKDTAADRLYAAITGVMAVEVPADQIRQVRLF